MTANHIDNLIASCDRLQQITCYHEGCMHTSVQAFNACMRAFDRKVLPAQALTFRVFLNAPVMKNGVAVIWRDGYMIVRTGEPDDFDDAEQHTVDG